jgi:plasmid stability protein
MATRVKKRTDTSTNRESDKIIVRLPTGMRAHLADMAARHGKSMNAEVVTALAAYIAHDGEPDQRTIKDSLGYLSREIMRLREQLLGTALLPIDSADQDAVRKSAPPLGLKEK